MKVERVHDSVRYTLSNECHKQGELVYPIAWGRQTDDGWILHDFKWKDTFSDFPNSPHTVKSIEVIKPKEVNVRTNYGYCFHDSYFKIIKVERQIQVTESMFGGTWEWQEFDKAELNIKAGNPNDLPF
jgi:hypothetical protein